MLLFFMLLVIVIAIVGFIIFFIVIFRIRKRTKSPDSPLTEYERKKLRHHRIRLYIMTGICFLVVMAGLVLAETSIKYSMDMEEAVTLISLRLNRDNDEIYRIQISRIYEQEHPDTLKDAADALWAATKIAENSTEEINMAAKLIEINKLTDADYSGIALSVRELAHTCDITHEQAIDVILDELRDFNN